MVTAPSVHTNAMDACASACSLWFLGHYRRRGERRYGAISSTALTQQVQNHVLTPARILQPPTCSPAARRNRAVSLKARSY